MILATDILAGQSRAL